MMKKGNLVKVQTTVYSEDGVILEGTLGVCLDTSQKCVGWKKVLLFLKDRVRVEFMKPSWLEKV